MHDGTSLPPEICKATEDASETKASVLDGGSCGKRRGENAVFPWDLNLTLPAIHRRDAP